MHSWIYQYKEWPSFNWDDGALLPLLAHVRHRQGHLKGCMEVLGLGQRNESVLQSFTADVLKSSEIEGEFLNPDMVRSSVARQLGLETAGLPKADRYTEGVVEMMLDATQHYSKKLTKERLFNWHAALFPTGRSGGHRIAVAQWRTGAKGPMQVVSGVIGKEKVHFIAPPAKQVSKEMSVFIKWFNQKSTMDPVLKAAIAHFWFVTIHPFEDGNGRIARALSDMLLARADNDTQRFYSLSSQIMAQQNAYYHILEKTQKGKPDITAWLTWFLQCLEKALAASDTTFKKVLAQTRFWDKHEKTEINERQRKILNRLHDGFEGKLNTSKWAKICKCSPDTALRDIQYLLKKKILKKEKAGGRSTGYVLNA